MVSNNENSFTNVVQSSSKNESQTIVLDKVPPSFNNKNLEQKGKTKSFSRNPQVNCQASS